MSVLTGRRIVLGVTGGIAAFKAIEVCRLLVDAGAHVAPILTKGAEHFVGRTTFTALASEPVHTSLWDDADPIPHTRLGQRADAVVVVPATARVLGAYAAGISSDLLTATLLASTPPSRTTWPPCAGGASTWWSPTSAGWPGATRAPGAWPGPRRSWRPWSGSSAPRT